MKIRDLGIEYQDGRGNRLGSMGGAMMDGAEEEARSAMTRLYPRAVVAILYEGRTLGEGRELRRFLREDVH